MPRNKSLLNDCMALNEPRFSFFGQECLTTSGKKVHIRQKVREGRAPLKLDQ